MTQALCLSCGNTKFGAIVPCPHCGVASCGDMKTDIAFSDHRLTLASLEALGGVIKAIRPFSEDPTERFWTFMEYISVNHPSFAKVEFQPGIAEKLDAILSKATPPPVVLEKVGGDKR